MENQESNKNEENEFPQSFFCPLTLELMKDPVVDPEGNSFERSAIENWLKSNNTSPITRNPLSVADLIPNRALRDAIEEKRAKNPNKKPVPPVKIVVPVPPPKKEEVKVDEDAVSLSISGIKNFIEDDSLVMVSVKPPKGTQPTPLDVVCVVDVSGSMGSEAKTQNSSGVVEGHGLSLLDIVKHAVKTIIHILTDHDRLSLVSFSTTAKVVFNLIKMDSAGKSRALKEVDKLATDDSTNLWDGLYTGLEVIRKSENKAGHLQSLLLLTDGQPNIVPPRGHLPMLTRYQKEHPEMNCTINTFGFGYNLDSALLQDLSISGNGFYAFIPDSGFVGTAFVHAISNLLSTISTNTKLSIELQNGATIDNGVLGGHPSQVDGSGVNVHMGSIQYEQQKQLVFRVKVPKDIPADTTFMTATLTYLPRGYDKPVDIKIQANSQTLNGNSEVEVHYLRLHTVDTIRSVMAFMKKEELSNAKQAVNTLVQSVRKSPASKDSRIKELLQVSLPTSESSN